MFPLILPSDRIWRVNSRISPKLHDIVLFLSQDKVIAHRLVYLHPQKDYFLTKGDNNLEVDPPLTRDQILGVVTHIKRGATIIPLPHLYLTQSTAYLSELSRLHRLFHKHHLSYLILKGLPLHLSISHSPPSRLYCDLDILIKPKYLPLAQKLLSQLGFQKKTNLKLTSLPPTQFTFFKSTPLSPITIDLHLEPGIAFTRLPHLNLLFPSLPVITRLLWKNQVLFSHNRQKYPLLENTTLLFFLSLHLYHHNFRGSHRLDLICELIKTQKIDWTKLTRLTHSTKTENFIFPVFLLLQKYYSSTPVPSQVMLSLAPRSFLVKTFLSFYIHYLNPFNSLPKNHGRLLRLVLLFILSPKSLFTKFVLIFNYPCAREL